MTFRHSDQVTSAAFAAAMNRGVTNSGALRLLFAYCRHVFVRDMTTAPGAGKLMALTGLSRSALYKARTILVNAGLIRLIRKGRPLEWRILVEPTDGDSVEFGSLSPIGDDEVIPIGDKKISDRNHYAIRSARRSYRSSNNNPPNPPLAHQNAQGDSPAADAASLGSVADLAAVREFASTRFAALRSEGIDAKAAHEQIAVEVNDQLGARPNSRPPGKPWTGDTIRKMTVSKKARTAASQLVERWQELRVQAGLPQEQGTDRGRAALVKILSKLEPAFIDDAAQRVEMAMRGLLATKWAHDTGNVRIAFLADAERIKRYRQVRTAPVKTAGMIKDRPDAYEATEADEPIQGAWT